MLRFAAVLAAFALSSIAASPTAHYRHHGPAVLNDLTVTPGVVSKRTKAQLCDPAFRTGTVRNVPHSLKVAVCAEYGIDAKHCNRGYEIDHLISLELGGANDIKNLWPEPYAGRDGARVKDVVEGAAHRAVCRGEMRLDAAQYGISHDWYSMYLVLGLDK